MDRYADPVGQLAFTPVNIFSSAPSPSRSSTQVGSLDYLSFQQSHVGSFCRNREGWGPLSPFRYDFTPCFLDVWIVAVAAFGIVFGSGAIWSLFKTTSPQVVRKDWHFWSKMGILSALMVCLATSASLQVAAFRQHSLTDFRFWSTALSIVGLGIIACVQYIEHWRARTPNGVVLFYWLFFLISYGVKLRSLVVRDIFESNLLYFVVFVITIALAMAEFFLEWLVAKAVSEYQAIEEEKECPILYATLFSRLWFSWCSPMMKFGYKHYLTQEDLWDIPPSDTSEACTKQLVKVWDDELARKKPSLWLALFRAYGSRYYVAAVFKVFSDITQFTQPQLLKLLIQWVESYGTDNPQPVIRGVAIALLMFASGTAYNVLLNQYFLRAYQTGLNVRSGLAAKVYTKALRLSNEARDESSTGDIVNHMGTDIDRLYDLTVYGQQIWSCPLQIALCMLSLYRLLGYSAFAGVGVMIASIPINAMIVRYSRKLQKRQMLIKDSRISLMSELLENMKSIKLYAWTTAFMSKLNNIRNVQELNSLRKIGATQAMANAVGQVTPVFVACGTFAVFVMTQSRPLSTDLVFPALTLFNLLTFPLAMLPMVITATVEAANSVERLVGYLTLSELQTEAVLRPDTDVKLGEESVRIADGCFTWKSSDSNNTLDNITFSARKGDLSCIIGRVGSGKSSLLQAMLGDLYKVRGEVVVRGKVAYVAQSAWVMNASVRENIVFGHRWDQDFYDRTIKACALADDLVTLPDGDQTEVGERGISLSGGQKARLTLARAVYARADIYILDDILSAVDQHVGRHIINNVIGPNGILQTKTRILATNAIRVLVEASFIILLRDGRILERGTYDQLMAMKGEVAALIKTATSEGNKDGSSSSEEEDAKSSPTYESDDSQKLLHDAEESEVIDEDDVLGDMQEIRPQLLPIKSASETRSTADRRRVSTSTLRRASTTSFHGPHGKMADDVEEPTSRQTKENMAQGKVKWSVYKEYAKASNLFAVAFYFVALVSTLAIQTGGNVWLKQWSEQNDKKGGNKEIGKYIGIYLAFGVATALLVATQTMILWIFCSIEASRKLHDRMTHAIFRAPMTFFETTPSGRILNRCSNDIYRIDDSLARNFNMAFNTFGKVAVTLIVISVTTPMFLLLIFPLGWAYQYLQQYYLATSRELKRLDSVSKSPIYAHFKETLNGMSTIRAYRQVQRFGLESEWRVDQNTRAWFAGVAANRWLAVRLEFLSSLVLLGAATFAIISVTTGSGISPGLVGLAVSYALQVQTAMNWFVRQTVEIEGNIVAVERVLEYAELPSEAPEVISKNRPPTAWPSKGAININHYSTRYRDGLDLVLKDINLEIKPREKIGVVGRTGAGKSSLTLALFRIIEPTSGDVVIDGIGTGSIGLLDLRRRLSIIPQDAAMFKGSIRDNLDPSHIHDDSELWSALHNAKLGERVKTMPGQLDAEVSEGGSNLSQGQRQLVSLARALLTPSNILVLDEATSSVDVETDVLIQETLRSETFKHRTIITIAHRINTVLDSDRIVVLSQGKVAEFDTPRNLVRKQGLFYELVKESGLLGSSEVSQITADDGAA